MKKTTAAALLYLLPALANAATPAEWLNSPAAQSFRQRVIDLALIYDEGSGIDTEGFKIDAKLTSERMLGCAVVQVVISRDGGEIRRESLPVCKAGNSSR